MTPIANPLLYLFCIRHPSEIAMLFFHISQSMSELARQWRIEVGGGAAEGRAEEWNYPRRVLRKSHANYFFKYGGLAPQIRTEIR